MGCVQSHQQDRGGRRQQDRRSQQHRPQQQQQQQHQRHRQQQQQQNEQSRQVPRKSSNDRNVSTSDHLYENVPPMGRIKNTDSVKNVDNVQNDDSQFRRQHFDRNSCLRHSKKRKKSTASNQNSPAILNGSEISDVQQQNRKNR